MTKAELIKKIESIPDDQQITFVLFDDHYQWRLLQENAQHKNDPTDVIGLVSTPYKFDKIQDASLIDQKRIATYL